MENQVITRDHPLVESFFTRLDHLEAGFRSFTAQSRPILNGEQYLTDKDLTSALKLSRYTLQDYRNRGRIPYLAFAEKGGKILYRASDIDRLLQASYRPVIP